MLFVIKCCILLSFCNTNFILSYILQQKRRKGNTNGLHTQEFRTKKREILKIANLTLQKGLFL